jgi:hypothetical protein
MNGIYSITFRGAADWGMGLLVFMNGVIAGFDVGGAQYDGNYTESAKGITADMILTVPPGVMLVQGTPPQPREYKVPFQAQVSKDAIEKSLPVLVSLPVGAVNIIFKRLRSL